eukprot:COSAG02_NODE_49605_length_325_cov_12.924528_1_plen_37_part_10
MSGGLSPGATLTFNSTASASGIDPTLHCRPRGLLSVA